MPDLGPDHTRTGVPSPGTTTAGSAVAGGGTLSGPQLGGEVPGSLVGELTIVRIPGEPALSTVRPIRPPRAEPFPGRRLPEAGPAVPGDGGVRRHPPAGRGAGRPGVGQLAVGRLVPVAVAHRHRSQLRPLRAGGGSAPLGERRPHGRLLLRRGPGDQARAGPRQAAGSSDGGHAGHRRPGRHGRARAPLPPRQRRWRRVARAGGSRWPPTSPSPSASSPSSARGCPRR